MAHLRRLSELLVLKTWRPLWIWPNKYFKGHNFYSQPFNCLG